MRSINIKKLVLKRLRNYEKTCVDRIRNKLSFSLLFLTKFTDKKVNNKSSNIMITFMITFEKFNQLRKQTLNLNNKIKKIQRRWKQILFLKNIRLEILRTYK